MFKAVSDFSSFLKYAFIFNMIIFIRMLKYIPHVCVSLGKKTTNEISLFYFLCILSWIVLVEIEGIFHNIHLYRLSKYV